MITPTRMQYKAVRDLVAWYKDPYQQEFLLAGFAGTGKSSVVNFAIEELCAHHGLTKERVFLGCYTGKAANVLKQKGNSNASTLHSLCYLPYEDPQTKEMKFTLREDSVLRDADLLIVDEGSFVNEYMAKDVRSFGCKIIVLYDPFQLQPVRGRGEFVRRQADAMFTEVHRQALDSPILWLATQVREGNRRNVLVEGDLGNGCRVTRLTADSAERVLETEAQILCGLNKVRFKLIQERRLRNGFTGDRPLRDERVIICSNNRRLGIFNGMFGTMLTDARKRKHRSDGSVVDILLDADDGGETLFSLKVHNHLFDEHFYGKSDRPSMEEMKHHNCLLDWGDVISVHKSQGSEWANVCLVDDSASFRQQADQHLYTGITRAAQELEVFIR